MITINWKTYKQKYFVWAYPIQKQLQTWVEEWLLEEVKEKPLSQKRAEAIERGKQHSTEYYSALSILEKLREWVDKELKLQGYEHQQILDKIDLLTSLETKEEQYADFTKQLMNDTELLEQIKKWPETLTEKLEKSNTPQFTPWQEEPEELFRTCKCDACKDGDAWLEPNMDDWTPIKGEEIEVSNDGKEWLRDIFEKMEEDWLLYYTKNFFWYFDYARPIKDSKELLPEFNSLNTTDIGRDLQIERITHFLHSQFPNSKPWKN